MKKIALIEDDFELKELLEKFLNYQKDYACEISVDSVEAFLDCFKNFDKPDVILTNIRLPGISGVEGLLVLKKELPDTEVIVFTVHDDPGHIFQAFRNGASGYLLKNMSLQQIKESIDTVLSGGAPMPPNIARKVVEHFKPSFKEKERVLTIREHDIVHGLVDGLSYKLIAKRFSISIDTVRQHIRSIYKKLNVNCKAEVISKHFRGEI